ncbi:glycosyltransferase, partial [Vibrio antiquarius]
MRSKFIVNLLPIKTGGGMQNALSFICSTDEKILCIVRKGTLLHKKCIELEVEHIAIRDRLIDRLLFEVRSRFIFKKGTVCFTYFGPPLLGSIGHLYNINGFAYSNLLHPEIDFWQDCDLFNKIKRKAIDLYRLVLASCCDELIFETELLKERADKAIYFKNVKRKHCVKMSPTMFLGNNTSSDNIELKNDAIKILFLCGAQRNKRIELSVELLKYLISIDVNPQLVLTLPKDPYTDEIFQLLEDNNLLDYVVNLGPINQDQVGSLLDKIDVIVNFSRLESFSNNFTEAWVKNKLLLVSDSEWARRSCNDAAMYIDFSNRSTLKQLDVIFNSPTLWHEQVQRGARIL